MSILVLPVASLFIFERVTGDLLFEIHAMQFVTKYSSLTILFPIFVVMSIMQLGDGDIICFQRSLVTSEEDIHRFPDVPSFLDYVHNWQVHNLLVVLYFFTLAFLGQVFIQGFR